MVTKILLMMNEMALMLKMIIYDISSMKLSFSATYSPYLISYFRVTTITNITQLDGIFFFALSLAVSGVSINLGEWFSNKLGVRPTAIIGSILVGCVMVLTTC